MPLTFVRLFQNEAIALVLPGDSHPVGAMRPRHFAVGRDAAARLIRAYLAELGEDLTFQGIDAELARLPGEYAPPLGALYLAWRGDDAVAVGGFRPTADIGTCELKRLYVTPEARGSGVGRRMLGMLLDAARQAGYRRVILDTLDRLTAANALYLAFGFEEILSYNGNPLPGARFFALDLPVIDS